MLISLTLLFCLALVPAGEGQAPDQLPGAAPPAQAAPVPAPFGEIPGLQVEGPPPDWIRPGLRLTYRRDAAYIPSANEMLVEGVTRNMLDLASSSTTGKKYSVEALPGTGSAGYLQFNVLALDAKQAVIQTDFHLFDGLDASAPVQKLESGFVASASMGGDLWMHPDALQKLAGTDSEARAGRAPAQGSAITRVEYKLGEALYQAAQIVQGSPASQSFSIWIYDLASGILLHSGSVARIEAQRTPEGATLVPSALNVRHTVFQGSRNLSLPWSNQPPPPWIGTVKSFRFTGKFSVMQQGLPSSPQLFDVALKVSARGPDWLQFQVGGSAPQPGEEDRVAGSRQLGGLWIPPAAIAGLKAGQILDQDPFTRVTTTVSSVDAQSLVLTLAGARQQKDLFYDLKSGILNRAVVTERILGVPGMANRLELLLDGTE